MIRCKGIIATATIVALLLPLYVDAQPTLKRRTVTHMTAKDNTQMQRQRSIISRLLRENFGYVKLSGNPSDLYYLQRMIDKGVVSPRDGYAMQALGVMLGDIMQRNMAARWVVVKDKYGRSRALQLENTESLFFPITMISRRLAQGKKVDVRKIYKDTINSAKRLTYKTGKYKQEAAAK